MGLPANARSGREGQTNCVDHKRLFVAPKKGSLVGMIRTDRVELGNVEQLGLDIWSQVLPHLVPGSGQLPCTCFAEKLHIVWMASGRDVVLLCSNGRGSYQRVNGTCDFWDGSPVFAHFSCTKGHHLSS